MRTGDGILKGTSTAGGYLVASELQPQNFIEMLRNKMMVKALGARIIGGLVGDISLPKMTGDGTAYWVSEGNAATASDYIFGLLSLTPKTVLANVPITRKMIMQSSMDVEALAREDLATCLALAIDKAAINGSGTDNQPLGILGTAGIGAVAMGENGGALTYAKLVALETAVSAANADIGTLAYLTNAHVRGALKTTQRFTNTDSPIWVDRADNGAGYGFVNGYTAAVSNQVPSTLTKGTGTGLSAIIFGNWSDLIIAQWGALDVLVDPYTGASSGTVKINVYQDIDLGVRHAQSFAAIVDAIA